MQDNTFLVDEEFNTVCKEYAATTQEIEAELAKYISCLKQIVSEKTLEGGTADALQGFAEVVEETIKGELESIGTRFQIITATFKDNITTADDANL